MDHTLWKLYSVAANWTKASLDSYSFLGECPTAYSKRCNNCKFSCWEILFVGDICVYSSSRTPRCPADTGAPVRKWICRVYRLQMENLGSTEPTSFQLQTSSSSQILSKSLVFQHFCKISYRTSSWFHKEGARYQNLRVWLLSSTRRFHILQSFFHSEPDW